MAVISGPTQARRQPKKHDSQGKEPGSMIQVTFRCPRRRRGARAFSLIEGLVAFTVLTLAILAFTRAYSYSFTRVGERDDELQAVSFGQQYMEYARELVRSGTTNVPTKTQAIDAGYPIVSGVMNYSQASPPPALPSPGDFTATATVTPTTSGSSNFYDVQVDVTWTWGSESHLVTLESNVALEGS